MKLEARLSGPARVTLTGYPARDGRPPMIRATLQVNYRIGNYRSFYRTKWEFRPGDFLDLDLDLDEDIEAPWPPTPQMVTDATREMYAHVCRWLEIPDHALALVYTDESDLARALSVTLGERS